MSPRDHWLDRAAALILLVLSGPFWFGAAYNAYDGMIFATFAWLVIALVFVGAAIFTLRD